jgi:hypothetical protein
MTTDTAPDLFKTYDTPADDRPGNETYGNMKIRVVVLRKKDDGESDDPTVPPEAVDDDLADTSKKPIDGFLESPKRGKECCVFVINGQRQDAWDDTFIVRDLGLKQLRKQMLVVVDLDELKPEAIAEIMQGTRQGFYQGNVYGAISKKLVKTLRNDPDLVRLQEEAQQSLLEMRAADAVVKNKLDKLIDGFHASAAPAGAGGGAAGSNSAGGPLFGDTTTNGEVVVMAQPGTGQAAELPVLIADPPTASIRLTPGATVTVCAFAEPAAEWANVQDFTARLEPAIPGLTLNFECGAARARLTLAFTEPDDMDEDEYPLSTTLTAFAKFDHHDAPRMLQLPVVIVRPRKKGKKKVRLLRPDPTYLRVASRQPIPLVSGGPTVHVRLIWDGQDDLLIGSPPAWTFSARCVTLENVPLPGVSYPGGGRVDILVDAPHGLIAGTDLNFEVRAVGPAGTDPFIVPFVGRIIDPNATPPGASPQRVSAQPPDTMGQRRPPYNLMTIKQEQWKDYDCWENDQWTADDVGCFVEPTDTAPLTLILNEDFDLIRRYCADMVSRNLTEKYIEDQKTRYYSTLAYHLYLMYLAYKKQMEASALSKGDAPRLEGLRDEINRLGISMVTMM